MARMEPIVRLDVNDHIATITLARPEARNALSSEMIEALHAVLDTLDTTSDVRVVVLAGLGKSFCAGMDLKAVQDDPLSMGDMLRALAAVSIRLRRLSMPTIAQVQGAAIGGGCGLMVVCDFALTHAEAKLGYPEVDLGICPAVVAPWLVKKIGAGRARAMLLAGGTLSGDEAHRAGLTTHLVPREDLETTTAALARRLTKGGPQALAATKAWLNELDGSLDDETVLRGAEISAELIRGSEAQERLSRLFSK